MNKIFIHNFHGYIVNLHNRNKSTDSATMKFDAAAYDDVSPVIDSDFTLSLYATSWRPFEPSHHEYKATHQVKVLKNNCDKIDLG